MASKLPFVPINKLYYLIYDLGAVLRIIVWRTRILNIAASHEKSQGCLVAYIVGWHHVIESARLPANM